jgi:hypothetical protein
MKNKHVNIDVVHGKNKCSYSIPANKIEEILKVGLDIYLNNGSNYEAERFYAKNKIRLAIDIDLNYIASDNDNVTLSESEMNAWLTDTEVPGAKHNLEEFAFILFYWREILGQSGNTIDSKVILTAGPARVLKSLTVQTSASQITIYDTEISSTVIKHSKASIDDKYANKLAKTKSHIPAEDISAEDVLIAISIAAHNGQFSDEDIANANNITLTLGDTASDFEIKITNKE